MGKLSEWCQAQPAWVVDAMQRAATSARLTEENTTALTDRVAMAHGMHVEGDRPCLAFDENTVVSSGTRADDAILHSIGPIQGLDRLIGGQTLKFALNGMTVVFGENGAGKSGYKRRCTRFYAALRETWERAVEEVVLNDVVRRFGSDVGTLRLGGVEVSDEDFTLIHRAMKRASEHSGHDQAQGRQIDMPTKAQMQADLLELTGFRTTKQRANDDRASRRRALVAAPPQANVA
jgi:hypothetical protein